VGTRRALRSTQTQRTATPKAGPPRTAPRDHQKNKICPLFFLMVTNGGMNVKAFGVANGCLIRTPRPCFYWQCNGRLRVASPRH
jgi:hypothetical protein